MTGLEEMKSQILDEAQKNADEILEEAKKEAVEIREAAQEEAQAECTPGRYTSGSGGVSNASHIHIGAVAHGSYFVSFKVAGVRAVTDLFDPAMIFHEVANVYGSGKFDVFVAKEQADITINIYHQFGTNIAPHINDTSAVYQAANVMAVSASHHHVMYYFRSDHVQFLLYKKFCFGKIGLSADVVSFISFSPCVHERTQGRFRLSGPS